MKKIIIVFEDIKDRVEVFNRLLKYEGVDPNTVYGKQCLDGLSVEVEFNLSDAQKIADNARCPVWLLELLEVASFTAREK